MNCISKYYSDWVSKYYRLPDYVEWTDKSDHSSRKGVLRIMQINRC